MTAQDIDSIPTNKIRSINTRVGNFGNSMQFKIMKDMGLIVVILREGLLKYLGNAQWAYMSGVNGKHFKTFKTSKGASDYINKMQVKTEQ